MCSYLVPDIWVGGIDALSLFNSFESLLHPVKTAESGCGEEPKAGQDFVSTGDALNRLGSGSLDSAGGHQQRLAQSCAADIGSRSSWRDKLLVFF